MSTSSLCLQVSRDFPSFFKFSSIFMNMQMRYYSFRTNGLMDLSNCNIDDIRICTNDNIGMKSAYLYF